MTLHTTKVIKAKISPCIRDMSISVDQIVYWLCEQNLYHCNDRITMIDFIHFGTYEFWFYTFCQLYIMDLYVLELYLLSCTGA